MRVADFEDVARNRNRALGATSLKSWSCVSSLIPRSVDLGFLIFGPLRGLFYKKMHFCFAFRSLVRTSDLWSKVLSLGKTQINLVFRSLIRTSDLWSKVLSFGKTQINLVFRSLIRTSDLWSKVLSFGKTQINLVFRSLIRTFVGKLCDSPVVWGQQ